MGCMYSKVREGILLAYGNPLLDISVNDDSCITLLERYDLRANDVVLAEDIHLTLYEDLESTYPDKVEYIAGGATLNTARAVQWMVQRPHVTSYFGCISEDRHGDMIKQKCQEAGVNARFQYTLTQPTGTCAAICTGNNRSLVAKLAAAECFTEDHLDDVSNWQLVEQAQFYYSAGFPLTVSASSMLRMARHANEHGKTYCLNLSATFLIRYHTTTLQQLLPYVDFLFGNDSEADEFAEVQGYNTRDRKEIAAKMAAWPKENNSKPRVVVITQGADPVLMATGDGVREFPLDPLPQSDIVDTNGAGDGFVGGFLSQLIQGKPLEQCVRGGLYVARVVVQQSGFTLPESPDFT